jgi:hypothetical protein
MTLNPDYRRCGKSTSLIRADERDGLTLSSTKPARQRVELWISAAYSKLTEIHKQSGQWILLCQIETASLMSIKGDHRDSCIAGIEKLSATGVWRPDRPHCEA